MANVLRFFACLTFVLWACPTSNIHATRHAAGQLTYRNVAQNNYDFTLVIYKDCNATIPLTTTQLIYFNSRTTQPNQLSVQLTQVGEPTEVSATCSSISSVCRGGTAMGTLRYEFVGRLILPNAAQDWVVYFRGCNRSAGVQNIQNPAGTCLYLEAGINNLDAPTNSSPRFNTHPVDFVCSQTDVAYDPLAVDPDRNLLKFRNVVPRSNTTSPVDNGLITYLAPYNDASPFPTASGGDYLVDSLTGVITYRASRNIRAVTAQRIEEYDTRGRLVGYVLRDMQFVIQGCNNNVPRLAGINGGNSRSITLCANTASTITFSASDLNSGDSVRIFAQSGLPTSANFYGAPSLGTTTATLNWTPTNADVGTRAITLTTLDNSCPQVGQSSQTYTLTVIPGPLATLRSDTAVTCGVSIPILVTIRGGIAPYTINWLGRPDTSRRLLLSSGSYSVTVTDANQCSSTDNVNLGSPDLQADFVADSTCEGRSSRLRATVTGPAAGPGLTYLWTFPNGQTSTLEQPLFAFGAAGIYPVTVRLRAANNCEVLVSKLITICAAPDITPFVLGATCQGDPVLASVTTNAPVLPSPCSIASFLVRMNNLGQVSGIPPIRIPTNLQVADTNRGTFTVTTQRGCVTTRPFTFVLKPKPQFQFSPRVIYYKCNSPDTLFRLKVWRPTSVGNLAYQVTVTGVDTSFTTPFTTADTSYFTIPVRSVQTVDVRASFDNGCFQRGSASVLFPITANIQASVFCRKGDTTRLSKTVSARWPINYFKWDLGNGDTSSLDTPRPLYPPDSAFTVRLFLRDVTGCLDTITRAVATNLPDTAAFVTVDTSCYRTRIAVLYPNRALITSWTWTGIRDSATFTSMGVMDSLLLTTPGQVPIRVRIQYKGVCTKSWTVDTVFVRNPVGIGSLFNQVCADLPSRLEGVREQSDYPIRRWYWKHFYSPNLTTPVAADTGRIVTRTFNRNGALQVRLQAYDAKGCPGWDTSTVNTVLVSLPAFDVLGRCEKDSLFFFYGRVPDQYENIRRFIYDFDDGTIQENSNGQVYHVYSNPGRYMIRLKAFSVEGCVNTDSSLLDLRPRPQIVFSPDLMPCSNTNLILDGSGSRPTVSGDSIINFRWLLGRTTLGTGPRITTEYQRAGNQIVTLIITASNGCRDSLAVPIRIRQRPTAGFTYDIEDVNRTGQLNFVNNTQNATKWRWSFGDGVRQESEDAQGIAHAYTSGGQYNVEQIADNQTGCLDTATALLDLRTYMALPDAFTPNGDGRNDALLLRHKFLKSVEEYSIYNRFGQAVFTSSDPKKTWDGTFNGREVPVGTYVYVVKAKTVFGDTLSLKGNLQLLR